MRLRLSSVVLLAIAACGGTEETKGQNAAGLATGRLTLDIAAPTSADVTVRVTGPGAFETTVSESTTLEALEAGEYRIAPRAGRVPGEMVDTLLAGTADRDTVVLAESGEAVAASVSVSFEPVPATGRLWATGAASDTLVGFSAEQLSASSEARPDVVISGQSQSPMDYPAGIAVDGEANVWVALCGEGPLLMRYAASEVATSGPKTAPIRINAPSDLGGCAYDLAFAPDGRLAVAAYEDGLLIYEPEQLRSSGAPRPWVIGPSLISYGDGVAWEPGNESKAVWIADYAQRRVHRYDLRGATFGDNMTPTQSWHAQYLVGPSDIDWDRDGNMFITDFEANAIFVIAKEDQSSLTLPAARATIESEAFNGIEAPAFDNAGNLWVPNFHGDTIAMLPAGELLEGGTIEPKVLLNPPLTNMEEPYTLAFSPPPSGYPVHTP